MLPHVLRFNSHCQHANALYSQIVTVIFGEGEKSGERMAAGFEDLAQTLGIETKLRQVGVKEADLSLLATEAMKQTRLLPNNPREVSLKDAQLLYEQAY